MSNVAMLLSHTHTHEVYSWGWVSSCCISYFYSLLAGPSGSWSPVVYLLVKTNILSSPGRRITARTQWTRDPACTASDQWQHPAGERADKIIRIGIMQFKAKWKMEPLSSFERSSKFQFLRLETVSKTCVGLGPGPGPIWWWWCSVLARPDSGYWQLLSKWIFENER